ncbi:hypothetical protein E2C01_071850 [Portunus trituberculatus]|uniref:Uncharacterized protein n=1 Tax=Portunus trituberculatus TaxID=210409 RepID=A0A5B7I933_PORTR|nr:hypothetical protein [Portunus trituberculatus]
MFSWKYAHEGNVSRRMFTAVVQWNHACYMVRGVSKRTGSNPVHGPSVGHWAIRLPQDRVPVLRMRSKSIETRP